MSKRLRSRLFHSGCVLALVLHFQAGLKASEGSADEESPRTLVSDLKSGNVVRRADAKRRLRLYHFREVARAMSDFADDPNPDIRILMAQTLGELGGFEAVGRLKDLFSGENDVRVRRAVLIQISGLMQDEKEALGFYRKVILSDPSEELRGLALTQAAQLGRGPAVEKDLRKICTKVWKNDSHRPNRVLGGLVLKELGDPDPNLGDAVLEALQSPSVEVRRRAALLTGSLSGEGAFDRMAVAVRDPDPEVRANLCRSMKESRNGHSVPILKILAADPDPNVRKSALDALAGFPVSEVGVAVYRDALADVDASVRTLAVGVLEKSGDGSVIQELEGMAVSDPDVTVRHLCKKAVAVLSGGQH